MITRSKWSNKRVYLALYFPVADQECVILGVYATRQAALKRAFREKVFTKMCPSWSGGTCHVISKKLKGNYIYCGDDGDE